MSSRNGIIQILDQLPVERLDAEKRRVLLAAREEQDDRALGQMVREAVGELLLAGDLIRVAVAGGQRNGHQLLLVRGTSRLIDCSILPRGTAAAELARLEADAPPMTGAAEVPETEAQVPTGRLRADIAVPAQAPSGAGIHGMLDAMERAQDLAVGDPRADDPWVLVNRILDLLQLYLPDLRLHAQLSVTTDENESAGRLLPHPDLGGMPFWLRHRRSGQSLWIPDAAELPRELLHRLELAADDSAVTAVVPIMSPLAREGEVGLLYVTGLASWSADELMRLAHRLSVFVSRRWRCQRDVNRRVLTDSLTGVPNRAFFDTQFPLELERVRRGNQPLTLVIADLDQFKNINDTHGHQCGDLALRSVARQLLSALRRIDVVCRIGGEEFALILPATSRDEARDVLSRIVGRPFRVVLPPELGVGMLSVTVSYGAVTFPEAGGNTKELHRKADDLLYDAKERGRNRCCLWTPQGIEELRSASSSG